MGSRNLLEAEVLRRAQHETAEDVRITCSFARAERLLGREYHGRFLIELLQNAADAWLEDPRAGKGTDVGHVIGRSVYDAVTLGVAEWNKEDLP